MVNGLKITAHAHRAATQKASGHGGRFAHSREARQTASAERNSWRMASASVYQSGGNGGSLLLNNEGGEEVVDKAQRRAI